MLTKLGSEAVNLEQPHVPRFAQATTSCVAPSFSGDPAKGRRTGPRRTTLGRRSGDVARPFPSLMIAAPEASGAAPPSAEAPTDRPLPERGGSRTRPCAAGRIARTPTFRWAGRAGAVKRWAG